MPIISANGFFHSPCAISLAKVSRGWEGQHHVLTGTIQLFNILETKPDIMGFSCLLGITRVANVFTILAFVAEFMKCEISDITSSTIHIVQLAVLVLDIVLTGAKIIISIGMNMIITGLSIVIETAMQFLPCM